MGNVVFKYGTLIRMGAKSYSGGKWDADLKEEVRNAHTNADLCIQIRVHFAKIDPASGRTGLYGDWDDKPDHPSKRRIQKWAPNEFEHFTGRLVREAQHFWNGVFWLQTPVRYTDLNWPDEKPTHRCNLYCRFELKKAHTDADAHYTIAVVRVQDSDVFRSDAKLYSQKDINSEQLIPHSTVKFWTHFHEVGHLLGLGHIGYAGHHNLHNDGSDRAYGVSQQEMRDVMGKGHIRHPWHASPWQEAAESFTEIPAKDWTVHMHHIAPARLAA